jgi:hypothetical protein
MTVGNLVQFSDDDENDTVGIVMTTPISAKDMRKNKKMWQLFSAPINDGYQNGWDKREALAYVNRNPDELFVCVVNPNDGVEYVLRAEDLVPVA